MPFRGANSRMKGGQVQMKSVNSPREEKHYRRLTQGARRSIQLKRMMKKYDIPSKGRILSGHFSPGDAIDIIETAVSRHRSISEVITGATAIGLPAVKKHYQPVAAPSRPRHGQLHRVHTVTPQMEEQMKKWNILKKGKGLSGHFQPEQAVEVLETARTRAMSIGSILKAAVSAGLPELKRRLPPVTN